MSSKKKAEAAKTNQKPSVPWVRLQSVAGSVDREVDEAAIEKLLSDRWDAKLQKNYTEADRIASTLQGMNIAYHDDQKTWYTKALSVKSNPIVEKPKKLTKKQERNKRQAEKNRRKKSLENGMSGESADDGNDDSEDEEPVKPAKKKSKKD